LLLVASEKLRDRNNEMQARFEQLREVRRRRRRRRTKGSSGGGGDGGSLE